MCCRSPAYLSVIKLVRALFRFLHLFPSGKHCRRITTPPLLNPHQDRSLSPPYCHIIPPPPPQKEAISSVFALMTPSIPMPFCREIWSLRNVMVKLLPGPADLSPFPPSPQKKEGDQSPYLLFFFFLVSPSFSGLFRLFSFSFLVVFFLCFGVLHPFSPICQETAPSDGGALRLGHSPYPTPTVSPARFFLCCIFSLTAKNYLSFI